MTVEAGKNIEEIFVRRITLSLDYKKVKEVSLSDNGIVQRKDGEILSYYPFAFRGDSHKEIIVI